jgi:hypothetical protein
LHFLFRQQRCLAGFRLTIWLFSLAGFHAYVVFSLTRLPGIIFGASLLLIPTLLATV